jgi:hypothetical protein
MQRMEGNGPPGGASFFTIMVKDAGLYAADWNRIKSAGKLSLKSENRTLETHKSAAPNPRSRTEIAQFGVHDRHRFSSPERACRALEDRHEYLFYKQLMCNSMLREKKL